MAKYRKKPVIIEAITFEEFVKEGIVNNMLIGDEANTSEDGIPWSFKYRGHPITHENDDCYLIPISNPEIPKGQAQVYIDTERFNRGDMLITGVNGEIYPCEINIFKQTYEEVENIGEAVPMNGTY